MAVPPPPPPGPSALSRAVAADLLVREQAMRVRGLMREDGGAVGADFTAADLTRNFIDIALFDEARGPVASTRTDGALRRWDAPVDIALVHGQSVPPTTRATQNAILASYANRLSAVTGHPVRMVPPGQENFSVFVVSEDERLALAPALTRRLPGIAPATVATIIDLPRGVACLMVAFATGGQDIYTRAVAIIRAEHPPASWRSCLHEEVAQGLGLTNDSPDARPSIFNDDEEFALLTGHDELLLSILYDRGLRPGMNAAQARPIVAALAREKLNPGPLPPGPGRS